jgi:methylenetetrahydrofolate--tRNA-(uracil-5-)-methyltransferase
MPQRPGPRRRINCPFTRKEYLEFVDALVGAERIELKEFEQELELGGMLVSIIFSVFAVEILAVDSWHLVLPIGLFDPRRPCGAQDNLGTLLSGFQTNLKFRATSVPLDPRLVEQNSLDMGRCTAILFILASASRSTLQFREDLFSQDKLRV